MDESTVRKWFARLRRGNFYLEHREHSGRPAFIDDDQIEALIKMIPFTRNIAEMLHIYHINRYDISVPCDVTEEN